MKVLTLGTFDLFHPGHLRMLQSAAKFGDLYVGVNSDAHVKEFKREPIMNEDERLEVVRGLRCVMSSFTYNGEFKDTIKWHQPDILAIGIDWAGGTRYLDHLGINQAWLDAMGITLVFLHTPYLSTTEIIERVKSR